MCCYYCTVTHAVCPLGSGFFFTMSTTWHSCGKFKTFRQPGRHKHYLRCNQQITRRRFHQIREMLKWQLLSVDVKSPAFVNFYTDLRVMCRPIIGHENKSTKATYVQRQHIPHYFFSTYLHAAIQRILVLDRSSRRA